MTTSLLVATILIALDKLPVDDGKGVWLLIWSNFIESFPHQVFKKNLEWL